MMMTVTLIKTYDTEEEAVKAMHAYARSLRRRRLTGRYGVFVEQRQGAWWLNLTDRSTK